MKNLFTILILLLSLATAYAREGSIVDGTFNPGSGVEGGIAETVVPLGNGKIYLSGNFTSFNGQNQGYIVRLNEDGSLDTTFKAAPGYWVRHFAVQDDGKVVIGGFFQNVDGKSRRRIARLNPDGSLDETFQVGTGCEGKIVSGDPTEPFVFQVALQPDGKIVIVGNFTTYNGVARSGIARLNTDGSLDTSFNPGNGFDSWGRSVQVLPDGKILATGWFVQYNNASANRMVRIFPDGRRDENFNSFIGDKTSIYSAALLPNQQLIVVGHSLNDQGLFNREMGRMNPDGSFDQTFTARTNEKTEDVLIQPDGKIIVGGHFTRANDQPRTSIARYLSDGTLDDFQATFDNFIWTVALDRNGKLLACGGFNTVDGLPRRGVVRLHTGVVPGTQNLPPTVQITSPAANAVFGAGANINIAASASDPDGSVAKVQFFANDTSIGESTSAPFAAVWSAAPAGTHQLRADVTDNRGTVVRSSVVTVVVQGPNQLPSITWVNPAPNSEFAASSSIQLSATATDSDGQVSRVRFYAGNNLLGEATSAPYSFQWQNVPAGEYDLKAEAEDNAGGKSVTANIRIKVVAAASNTPRIKSIQLLGTEVKLTLLAPAGASYQVQATPSLTTPQWQTVWTPRGSHDEILVTLPKVGSNTFYRVYRP